MAIDRTRTLAGSQPDWNVLEAIAAPDILLVLIDDAGFGNPSAFGKWHLTPDHQQGPFRSPGDIGLPVDRGYADKSPFAFTGMIRKVVFDVAPHITEVDRLA